MCRKKKQLRKSDERVARRKRKGCWKRLLQSRVSWNVGQSKKQDWIGLVLIERTGQGRPDDGQVWADIGRSEGQNHHRLPDVIGGTLSLSFMPPSWLSTTQAHSLDQLIHGRMWWQRIQREE